MKHTNRGTPVGDKMRFTILLSASLAVTACTTSVPAPSRPRAPVGIDGDQCGQAPCRIGANGTRVTGLVVDLPGGVRAIVLPSGERISLR